MFGVSQELEPAQSGKRRRAVLQGATAHRAERGKGSAATMTTRTRTEPQIAAGRKVRDPRDHGEGVVLDHACQYAHPKAPPVYSYLVRWSDGQVCAYTEAAFFGEDRLEVLE
jgi:hypothetical protein